MFVLLSFFFSLLLSIVFFLCVCVGVFSLLFFSSVCVWIFLCVRWNVCGYFVFVDILCVLMCVWIFYVDILCVNRCVWIFYIIYVRVDILYVCGYVYRFFFYVFMYIYGREGIFYMYISE